MNDHQVDATAYAMKALADAKRLQGQRLLAHVMVARTRWFKVSGWLLEVGRKGVPESRDSYNPVKWSAAQLGLWMQDRQIRSVNRKFNKEHGL